MQDINDNINSFSICILVLDGENSEAIFKEEIDF